MERGRAPWLLWWACEAGDIAQSTRQGETPEDAKADRFAGYVRNKRKLPFASVSSATKEARALLCIQSSCCTPNRIECYMPIRSQYSWKKTHLTYVVSEDERGRRFTERESVYKLSRRVEKQTYWRRVVGIPRHC